jgi:hypothetical protein
MISDAYLVNIAKAMSGVSYSYPTYCLVGTGDTTTLGAASTVLPGELGARKALSTIRTGNQVDFQAVRLSTDVLGGTAGDALTCAGVDIASTGGNLQLYTTLSELQTTAFDIQFDFIIDHLRKV